MRVFTTFVAAVAWPRREKVWSSSSEFGEASNLNVSGAFFREESRLSRDIAVLAAELACRDRTDSLIVDAFAGAGSRALRYARDVRSASRVIANEASLDTQLAANALNAGIKTSAMGASRFLRGLGVDREAVVVDADPFGLKFDVGDAVGAVSDGGIVQIATTGAAAAGARGVDAKAALRARMGCAAVNCGAAQNEFGLRALFGRAAACANAAGDALTPVCALYSPHGPVFRIIARVRRRKKAAFSSSDDQKKERGRSFTQARKDFLAYHRYLLVCRACGHATPVDCDLIGAATCADCGQRAVGEDVAGPVWTGPLYDADSLRAMRDDAADRGWLERRSLKTTLDLMLDEVNDPRLLAVPLYTSIDAVARQAKVPTPPLEDLASVLKVAGYAVSKTHIDRKGIRTDAPMSACVTAAKDVATRNLTTRTKASGRLPS